ncbi:MAG: dockerin type I domain-containing protein, partial [Armatimonadota bacterium]
RVYPADVGRHTLVVGYLDLGPLGTGGWRYGQVPVEILPRTGWPSVQPLPTQPQTGLAGGVLGYFRYSADRSATSLVLTNGVQTKEVGSAAVPPLLIGGPAWSPDGSALAFSAVFDTTPYSNLYVLGPAGVSQITGYGGYPPRITGPGRGSLVGVLKLPETPPAPDTDPGEDACGELAQNIEPAKGMWVTLVGTGMVVPAFPDDPALGKNANYRYRFDNVPEGEYWLHAWFSTTICQGATISSTTRDAEGNLVPTTKHSRRPAGATPNTSVPVVVRAGIVTEVGNLTPLWTWQLASGPTWADAQTLMYTLYSGVYDRFGVALSDAWSVRIGDRPVQLSDTLKHGKVGDLAATLATGKLLWVEDNIGGLAVGDLANPAGTGAVVTSILARMSENLFPNDASPSWAPDGTHIAFIRSNVLESAGIGTISDPSDIAKIPILGLIGDVWIKNVATGAEKQLTRFRVSAGEGAVGRPAWSPDRSQIAVTYTRDNLRSTDIVVINVADGSEFAITNDGQSMRPAWRGTVGFNLQDLPAGIALEPGKQTIRVTPARRKGDTNGDGAVTTMDALLALRIGLGFQQGTAEQVASADLDGNGRVDVVDVARILRIAIGLEAG